MANNTLRFERGRKKNKKKKETIYSDIDSGEICLGDGRSTKRSLYLLPWKHN